MTALANRSIRHRLTRFMALVTAGALLCMAVGFLSYEYVALKSTALRNARAQAEVVASSSDAALEFGASADAEKILAALAVDRQIRMSGIYDQAGNLFAVYPAKARPELPAVAPRHGSQFQFWAGTMDVSRPIVYEGRLLGTAFIRTDLGELKAHLILTCYVLCGLGLVTFAGVYLASMFLQKQISEPILVLSEAARRVSLDKDYGIRLERTQGGEIGVLTDSLNDMLAQIQARDAQLLDYQDSLEDQVAQRSEQLLRVNTQLLLAKERAEEASHTKSAFLANMSHELRTPLNAILLYSEILIDEVTERGAEVLTGDLHKIQNAGRHLLSLIDDILDLSKIEAGRMTIFLEEVNIPDLLGDIRSTLEPLAARNRNRLEIHADPGILTLNTDHKRLKQTLYNLLDNASKFTKDGTISLTLEFDAESASLVFEVRDTGIGMSPEQVERIFQEFTQGDSSTTRRFGGTGLGLALSRKFAEMLGGTIKASSQEGVGSCFTLRIPQRTDAVSGSVFVPAKQPFAGHRGKVLIIDDDPAMREAVSRMLTRDGFWVAVAANGEEGLQIARTIKPNVITLDIAMPGMDGWEVLTLLKAAPDLKDIPVVLITMMDGRAKGFALGASDYLQKPVPRDQLLRSLERFTVKKTTLPVLVVEDDPSTLEGLERILGSEGWAVHSAHNGAEALEQIKLQVPAAILLDLMMPGMDGFTLITRLQTSPAWQSIPVIILTAKELTEEDQIRLQAPQVRRILRKGACSKERLLETVSELTIRCIEEPAIPAREE